MRIAIVTLNPGVDRVVYLGKSLDIGGHNRSTRAVVSQGSKGANQAILLKNLGNEPDYFAFTGGEFGALSESYTKNHCINSHFVETKCGVRLNIKVIEPDGRGTELNEMGGPVDKSELDALFDMLFSEKFDIISLCGSFPQGVENTVYNSVITCGKQNGAKVVLDCSGEALRLGASAKPYVIKPNRAELAAFGFEPPRLWKTAVENCRKIYSDYGTNVLCTLDSDGSVYVGDEGAFRITVNERELRGFSGAGDSYLAAFIHSKLINNQPIEDALRFSAAAAAAKISLDGTLIPTKEQILAAIPDVTVEKIEN